MTVSLLHDFSSQYKGEYAYHINQDAGWLLYFPLLFCMSSLLYIVRKRKGASKRNIAGLSRIGTYAQNKAND